MFKLVLHKFGSRDMLLRICGAKLPLVVVLVVENVHELPVAFLECLVREVH